MKRTHIKTARAAFGRSAGARAITAAIPAYLVARIENDSNEKQSALNARRRVIEKVSASFIAENIGGADVCLPKPSGE